MGAREKQLKEYLKLKFGSASYSKPSSQGFINSGFNAEIRDVYRMLGGLQKEYPTNFRGFDIQLDNYVVELDEERHFNRFRLITLNSPFYAKNKNFNVKNYQSWCSSKEDICLRTAGWRNNWENKNSKIHFGESDPEGILKTKGGTRWKQRAFFDLLRDVSSCLLNIPILRISVYHELDGATVNEHLMKKNFEPIANYIEKYAR
jgi:hypothetical protein